MKVTLTLKRAPSPEDIAFIESSLREIHPDITETSRESLCISFTAPTTDVVPFVQILASLTGINNGGLFHGGRPLIQSLLASSTLLASPTQFHYESIQAVPAPPLALEFWLYMTLSYGNRLAHRLPPSVELGTPDTFHSGEGFKMCFDEKGYCDGI